jgi:hypothetical protein
MSTANYRLIRTLSPLDRRGPVMPPRQFDELRQGVVSIAVDSAARKIYCATPGQVLVLGQQD